MDHSIPAYLQRRTTAELEGALQQYLQDKNCLDYAYAILEILRILEQRYQSPKGELPDHIQKAWEKFREYQRQQESTCQ